MSGVFQFQPGRNHRLTLLLHSDFELSRLLQAGSEPCVP